jgi:hypothetical protein
MRRLGVAGVSAAALVMGAGLGACFDLFHSTRDVLTLCQIDARAPACGFDASDGAALATADAPESDFCSWRRDEAHAHARHACAWLAACETPTGRNAFGSCLFRAVLAFDCAANENHRVKGQAHALWDCLWRVNSCDDVERCVFPDGPPASCLNAGDYSACGVAAPDGSTNNVDVRIECRDGSAYGENCALWGQTCASDGGWHACAGAGGLGCGTRACAGRVLEWCVANGNDVGIDCASNGAQQCNVLPEKSDAHWAACAPEGDGGTCVPDAAATCAGGIAASCPSGIPERIDCASLLEADAAVCSSGPLMPPFDWTSSCAVTPPQCDADECTQDGGLSACVRGATVGAPFDCIGAGLGACRTFASTPNTGDGGGAACRPPGQQ